MFLSCALVATIHDPHEKLLIKTRLLWPQVRQLYSAIGLVCTPLTPQTTLGFLTSGGARVSVPADIPIGTEHLGRARTRALVLGLELGEPYLHFCDFDRLLHWLEFYPNELRRVVAGCSDYDFVILGRTRRAFVSHSLVQQRTEAIANYVFSQAAGHRTDITAGARLISRPAAEVLVSRSTERTCGTDAEWPLLLEQTGTFRLGYRRCEGLEFETPDRYEQDIQDAGGVAFWMAAHLDGPQIWAHRLRMAAEIVDAVGRLKGSE